MDLLAEIKKLRESLTKRAENAKTRDDYKRADAFTVAAVELQLIADRAERETKPEQFAVFNTVTAAQVTDWTYHADAYMKANGLAEETGNSYAVLSDAEISEYSVRQCLESLGF